MEDLPIINSRYTPRVSQRVDGKGKSGPLGRNPRQMFALDGVEGYSWPAEDGSGMYLFRPDGISADEYSNIYRVNANNLTWIEN